MTIESAIKSHLETEFAADASLSAFTILVYPEIGPETADYPFCTLSIMSTDIETFLNATQSDLDFTEQAVDVQVWSQDAVTRALILDSIKTIMHGVTGNIGTENLHVRRCVITNITTFSERELTGTDENIYRASVALNITYNWS